MNDDIDKKNLKKSLAIDTDQSYTMQTRDYSCNLCAAPDRILKATARLSIEKSAFRNVFILNFRSIFGIKTQIKEYCDLNVID